MTKPDRRSGDSSTTATRFKSNCRDVQGRVIDEQQAIAAADGRATGKIACADFDRDQGEGRRIHQVKPPFAHVNEDEILSVRCRSNPVGSWIWTGATAPNTEVGGERNQLSVTGLTRSSKDDSAEKRPGGVCKVRGKACHYDIVDAWHTRWQELIERDLSPESAS